MRSIKNYRVTLLMSESGAKEFTNINEVNNFIDKDLKRNQQDEFSYLVESYDWDKLEFLPLTFGKIKNKLKNIV
jgi:hypothetical protein